MQSCCLGEPFLCQPLIQPAGSHPYAEGLGHVESRGHAGEGTRPAIRPDLIACAHSPLIRPIGTAGPPASERREVALVRRQRLNSRSNFAGVQGSASRRTSPVDRLSQKAPRSRAHQLNRRAFCLRMRPVARPNTLVSRPGNHFADPSWLLAYSNGSALFVARFIAPLFVDPRLTQPKPLALTGRARAPIARKWAIRCCRSFCDCAILSS